MDAERRSSILLALAFVPVAAVTIMYLGGYRVTTWTQYSAVCNDGSYSRSAHRQGTCSFHSGVDRFDPPPVKGRHFPAPLYMAGVASTGLLAFGEWRLRERPLRRAAEKEIAGLAYRTTTHNAFCCRPLRPAPELWDEIDLDWVNDVLAVCDQVDAGWRSRLIPSSQATLDGYRRQREDYMEQGYLGPSAAAALKVASNHLAALTPPGHGFGVYSKPRLFQMTPTGAWGFWCLTQPEVRAHFEPLVAD